MRKTKQIVVEDLDIEKNLGKWIITLNSPYCGEWYYTILKLYHKGAGPCPLVHIVKEERHVLDVESLKSEDWFDINLLVKRKDTGEVILFKGNLGGRFIPVPIPDE